MNRLRPCGRCGAPWDGLTTTNQRADRDYCNLCAAEMSRSKRRPTGWKVLHTFDYYNWTVEIIANDSCVEYMVYDELGRCREISENGYGNIAVAVRDGLNSMFTIEANSDNQATTP